ncbi:hypothetical protein [Nonomuraea wenchangensis]|uniref:hypothetical protein n=1 Tax=Nonomuraea wenchangensis TaxID=568860 RepID=UPI0033318EF9
MSTPYNTSKTDPLLLLADMMGPGGTSGAIERMEAQGQRQIVNSDVIPVRINSGSEEDLTALGFKLGGKVEGDPLFRYAVLPDGWKRQGSEHAMWSHIVDELGRKRISIFYKAAFYDRDAFLGVMTVYAYVGDCIGEKRTPVLDETWATRKDVHAAAVGQIAQCAKYLGMYDARDGEYGLERAAELRAEIAAYQALIDSLSVPEAQSGGAA